MKASELMIGNWVIVYEKAMPVKARVESVFGRGAMVLGHVRSADLGFMAPIPLTPEILEKNGFLKQAGEIWECDIFSEDKKFVSMIVWRRDYATPNLSVRSFTLQHGSYSRRNVNYVHELQNVLSLCGIEKEITI